MSKLERLLNLTALLLNTERPLRVDQIEQMMEGYPADPASFRRTFERDKDDLREMGIPVEVINTDVHDQTMLGYRILPERYYLADPQLDPDELAAMRLALGAIRLEGIAANETMRKLGGSPDTPDSAASPSIALASVPAPPELAPLYNAITERRRTTFIYNGAERIIEPHRLDYQRGRWYLDGFDHLREDRRNFRLDRIEGPISTGEPGAFEPPERTAGERYDPWRFGDDPPVTARLRIDASHAPLSRDLVGSRAVWTDHPDGSAEVEMVVANRSAFRTFVLGFLEHAEILEPQELRDELVTWIAECVA